LALRLLFLIIHPAPFRKEEFCFLLQLQWVMAELHLSTSYWLIFSFLHGLKLFQQDINIRTYA